jgi:lincosamide nucleotidyltransferase A/C/D/E
MRKEMVNKEDLLEILDLLDSLNIRYWIEGGWGVDILLGKENREHRDIDVDFDGEYTGILLDALNRRGFVITTDWSPSRIELHHTKLGFIDIHPLIIQEDGSAKQADPQGGWYEFKAEGFSSALFEGRLIPCITAQAQKCFHKGYELREIDLIDLKNLGYISE